MTPDERAARIQDYLDGRMSDDERRAFEAELASDSELAGEVDDARALGEALRAIDPPLPDGFYDRAAARFRERERERRGLSWEALGLFAAALLLGAILVPWNLPDRSRPADMRVVTPLAEMAAKEDERPESPSQPEPTAPFEKIREEQPREKKRADATAGAPGGFAPAPVGDAAPADADALEPRDRPVDTALADKSIESRPAPRSSAPPAVEGGARQRPAAFGTAREALLEDEADAVRPLAVATTLPVGRIDDPTMWQAHVADASDPSALLALAPDFTREHVVIVSGPAACAEATIRVEPDGPVVDLPGGADLRCAVRVPRDRGEVRVERLPGGTR